MVTSVSESFIKNSSILLKHCRAWAGLLKLPSPQSDEEDVTPAPAATQGISTVEDADDVDATSSDEADCL
jgi:hypothetical protein